MKHIIFYFSFYIFFGCFYYAEAQTLKREEIKSKVEKILTAAKTANDIGYIKEFLQISGISYPELFESIPDLNPINPINNTEISSTFSSKRLHPIYHKYKAHNGIDIVAKLNTPIYAAAKGKVVKSKFYNGSAGHSVEIKHNFGFTTKYFHLSFFLVMAGDLVEKGDIIGYLGESGGVTGPHLHYEILKNGNYLNPKDFL